MEQTIKTTVHQYQQNSYFLWGIWQRGSYTIEAAVYVPMIMFLILVTIRGSISFYKESKNKEVYEALVEIDTVSEFYTYQMIKNIGEESADD